MISITIKYLDKLEDRIRNRLSHWPIVYAFIGGTGVILFWRGVWHSADLIVETLFVETITEPTVNLASLPWWDGPVSMLAGALLLLMTGLFVSSFIGNEVIISGLKGEKKLTDKTEAEVRAEAQILNDLKEEVDDVARQIGRLGN